MRKANVPEFFTYLEFGTGSWRVQGFLEREVQKNYHNVLLQIKFPICNSDLTTIRH